MKKETGIKYVVKLIYITKPLQKIHFTIRHPENALHITGIAVTGTNNVIRDERLRERNLKKITGAISLAIPEEGDVFYTEEVRTETIDFREFLENKIDWGIANVLYAYAAKPYDYFDTCIPVKEALLEGYYEDTATVRAEQVSELPRFGVTPSAAIPIPRPQEKLYKITLYLRYQMKVLD